MYTKCTYKYMLKKIAKKLIMVITSGEGESEDLWWEEEFSLYCLPSAWISILNTDGILVCTITWSTFPLNKGGLQPSFFPKYNFEELVICFNEVLKSEGPWHSPQKQTLILTGLNVLWAF